MTESVAQQFIGAVGPAFDENDLALILDSSDRLIFASASAYHGVIAAAEAVIAMIHCTRPPQNITGIAALLQAPRDGLFGSVRTLTRLLHHAHFSGIDLLTGRVAMDQKAASEVTVSTWVKMR